MLIFIKIIFISIITISSTAMLIMKMSCCMQWHPVALMLKTCCSCDAILYHLHYIIYWSHHLAAFQLCTASHCALQNGELEVYGPLMDPERAGFFDEVPRLPRPTPTAQLRVLIPFDCLPSQIGFAVSFSDLDSLLLLLFDQRHAFGSAPVSMHEVQRSMSECRWTSMQCVMT